MDGFTYHNIFETKGIEYIIVIAFLLILIPFWMILNKKTSVVQHIHQAIDVLTASLLRIPQGIFYSKNHTWAYLEKSGFAKIGLDDFLLQVVGPVKIHPLLKPGETIRKGDVVAEIEQQGKRLKLTSPISGEIMQMNSLVEESPGLLNEDPYDKGWIYAAKPKAWVRETQTFFMADEATKWIAREVDRFKDFLAESLGKHAAEPSLVAYQEGGELRRNVLQELDSEIWNDFQDSFLSDASKI